MPHFGVAGRGREGEEAHPILSDVQGTLCLFRYCKDLFLTQAPILFATPSNPKIQIILKTWYSIGDSLQLHELFYDLLRSFLTAQFVADESTLLLVNKY